MSVHNFGSITVLRSQPQHAEALELLTRAAKQVQPILKKRSWFVGKLIEFVPKSPNLLGLNVNRGQEIKIRLRPPGSEGIFYEWHHVLGTVLHELVHIVHGPHNAAFYKLLDELWEEAEDLMDRGISGTCQGFDAPSAGRLGSHSFLPAHNPPEHQKADAIRKAAEARARKAALMPAGPQKLGGSCKLYKQMTPAQAAAAAAERRARDNLWCGAEHPADTVEQELGSDTFNTGRTVPGVAQPLPPQQQQRQQQSRQQVPKPLLPAQQQQQQHKHHCQQQQQQHQQLQQEMLSAPETTAFHGSRSPGGHAAGDAAASCTASSVTLPLQQALRGGWQKHLQRVKGLRAQQQRQATKKRPAIDSIDLTFSDEDENEGGGGFGDADKGTAGNAAVVTGAASGPASGPGGSQGCPSQAASGAVGTGSTGQRRSCHAALCCHQCNKHQHRRQQQQQGQQEQQQHGQEQQRHNSYLSRGPSASSGAEVLDNDGAGLAVFAAPLPDSSGSWGCQVCTMINRPLALQCEACCSVRGSAVYSCV